MSAKPLIIVVSGPSGSGKGTLCKMLQRAMPDLVLSISVTTRPPRSGEVNGVDYFFVSTEEFKKMLQDGELIEWAEVYENCYGTPRSFLESNLKAGKDVLLELDIQGAQNIKKIYPQAILIFIKPPSLEELGERIIKRGTDSEETIRKRMSFAQKEIQASENYDYVIVNDEQERALAEIVEIIQKEKKRLERS